MQKLSIHPVPILLIFLLFSAWEQPTSPVSEAANNHGLVATSADSDGVPLWCSLTCYERMWCGRDQHWAGVAGDRNEWDGGNHYDCFDQPCGFPPDGRHAPCTPVQHDDIAQIDEAVASGSVDQLVEMVTANELVVLNHERLAIQVWTSCENGHVGVHYPLLPSLFNALLLAQDS